LIRTIEAEFQAALSSKKRIKKWFILILIIIQDIIIFSVIIIGYVDTPLSTKYPLQL